MNFVDLFKETTFGFFDYLFSLSLFSSQVVLILVCSQQTVRL